MPDGFRFAVKAPPRALRDIATLRSGCGGSATGSGRCGSSSSRHATTGCSRSCSARPTCASLDLRDELDGVDVAPAVRVNDWDAEAPFRYLRFREPLQSGEELAAIAARVEPLFAAGVDVFAYFRHEDAPDAPAYAARLLELSVDRRLIDPAADARRKTAP